MHMTVDLSLQLLCKPLQLCIQAPHCMLLDGHSMQRDVSDEITLYMKQCAHRVILKA